MRVYGCRDVLRGAAMEPEIIGALIGALVAFVLGEVAARAEVSGRPSSTPRSRSRRSCRRCCSRTRRRTSTRVSGRPGGSAEPCSEVADNCPCRYTMARSPSPDDPASRRRLGLPASRRPSCGRTRHLLEFDDLLEITTADLQKAVFGKGLAISHLSSWYIGRGSRLDCRRPRRGGSFGSVGRSGQLVVCHRRPRLNRP